MNKYLDILAPNIDQYGFIAEASGDGGDSARMEGQLLVYAYSALQAGKIQQADFDQISARYIANYEKLTSGIMWSDIRRHQGSALWYDLGWRGSRDQWTPNAIALGMVPNTFWQKCKMIASWSTRGFLFATNFIPNYVVKGQTGYKLQLPDLTVLSSWGFALRWLGYAAFPLLIITDLDLLVGSLTWRSRINDPTNTNTDINNHVNALLQARYKCPTPISWLARKLLNVNDVLKLLNGYYGPGAPQLNQVASDFLSESWS